MKKLWVLIIIAFAFRFFFSFLVWHPDVNNNIDWGLRFWQYGPAKFYTANVWNFTWPNQPPGTMYMFAGVRKLYEGVFASLSYLHFSLRVFPGSVLLYLEKNLYPALSKLPAILSDLGIGWLIYEIVRKITGKRNLAVLGAGVWLFNPVIWYNSAVWGQYDSVINFLALFAFYFLIKKKLDIALLLFTLSLYTKASLLIFAPIFLIIALRQKYTIKKYILSVFISLIVIIFTTLPFSQGDPFRFLYYIYKDKVFVDQLHVVTANGFNLWGAIFGVKDSAVEISESIGFLGIAYKYWSYLLYGIFYIPSLWLVYKKQDIKSVVWSLAAAAFSSFMLLTNMHERYLYPLFPYFTILVIVSRRFWSNYLGVSVVNLINLYNFWYVPAVPVLISLMENPNGLLLRILSILGVILFVLFYVRFIKFGVLGKVDADKN